MSERDPSPARAHAMEPHEHPAFWAGPEGRVLADAVLHEHLCGGGGDADAAFAAGGSLEFTGANDAASILVWQGKKGATKATTPNQWKMQNDVYDRCGKLDGQLDSLGTIVKTTKAELLPVVTERLDRARKTITSCYSGVVNITAGGDPRSPTTMLQFEAAVAPVLERLGEYPADEGRLRSLDALALKQAAYVTRVPHVLTLRPWQLRVLAAIFHNSSSTATPANQKFNPSTTARAALVDVWQHRGLRAGVAVAAEQATATLSNPLTVQCPLENSTRRHPVLQAKNANPDVGMGSRFVPDGSDEPSWIATVATNAGAQQTYTMQDRWVVRGGTFPEGQAATWQQLLTQIRKRLADLPLLLGDQSASTTNPESGGSVYKIRLLADDEVDAIVVALTPELLGWSTPAAGGEPSPVPTGAGLGSWWDSILRWAEGGWDGLGEDLRPGPLRDALATTNGQTQPTLISDGRVEYGQPRVLQRAMEAARGGAAAPPAAAAAAGAPPANPPADPPADPQAGFPYRLVATPAEVWNAKAFPYNKVPESHWPDTAPSIFFASRRGYAWALTTVVDLESLSEQDKPKYDYEKRYHRMIDGPGVMRYVASTDDQWRDMCAYIRDGWKKPHPDTRRIAMASRERKTPDGDGTYRFRLPDAWTPGATLNATTLVGPDEMYNTALKAGRKTLIHSPWDNTKLQFENDVYIGPLYGDGPMRTSRPTRSSATDDPDQAVVANMGRGSGMTGTHVWFHHRCSYSGEWYNDLPHGRGRFVHGIFLKAEGIALMPPFIWIGEWSFGKRTSAEGWLGQFSATNPPTTTNLNEAAWARFDPEDPNNDSLKVRGVTWKKGKWPQGELFQASAQPAAAAATPAATPAAAPPAPNYKTVLARSEALAKRIWEQLDGNGAATGESVANDQRAPVRDAVRQLVALPKKYQTPELVKAMDESDEIKGKTVLREVEPETLEEFKHFFAVSDPRHLGQGNDADDYARRDASDPDEWTQPAGVEDLQFGRPVYGRIVPLKVFRVDYTHQFTASAAASSSSDADKVRMKDQYHHIRETIEHSRATTKYTRKRIMPAQRRSELNPRGVSAATADGTVVDAGFINGKMTTVDPFFCDNEKRVSLQHEDADDGVDHDALTSAMQAIDQTLDDTATNVDQPERKYHKLRRDPAEWPSWVNSADIQLDDETRMATCALRDVDTRLEHEHRVDSHGPKVGQLKSEVTTRTGVLATKPGVKADLEKSSNGALHADANETLLLHGTTSTNAALILANGFSTKFASHPYFGLGLYFAEEPAKCDQYGRLAYRSATLPNKAADLGLREFLDISDESIKADPPALESLTKKQDVFYMLVVRAALGTPAHVGHRTIKDHNRRGNFMSPEWDYYDRQHVKLSELPEDLKKLAKQKPPTDGGQVNFEATPELLEGIWKHHWEDKPDAERYKHSDRVDRVLEGLRQKRDFLKSGEHGKSYKLRSLSTLFVENRFFDTGNPRRYAQANKADLIPRVGYNSSHGDTAYAKKAEGGFLTFNIDRQEQLHRSHHSILANGYGSRTMLANGNHSTPTAQGFQYGSLMKCREFVIFQQYEQKAVPVLPAYLVAYKRVKDPDTSATSLSMAFQPESAIDELDGYSDKDLVPRPITFRTSSLWEMVDPYSPLGEHDKVRWRHTLRDYPTIYRFSPYLWGRKTRIDSFAPRALFDYWGDYYRAVIQPAGVFNDTTPGKPGAAARVEGRAYYPDESGSYDAQGEYESAQPSAASTSQAMVEI